jgi:RNA polymerase sigma-70 factor (ECF subfamily)
MDDTLFEEIYSQTARPLWAYLARMSGNSTLADDLLQETYLSFLRSPFTSTELGEIRPYLYKIATNLVYRSFRKAQRESAVEISEGTSGSVYENLEMTQMFLKLSPRERSLLWLAHVEEYDHREISRILGVNALSVRVLLYRARRTRRFPPTLYLLRDLFSLRQNSPSVASPRSLSCDPSSGGGSWVAFCRL